MALLADRESRLLIDGKLVAGSGGTFPTINPATEEVLGVAADADGRRHGARRSARRGAPSTTPTGRPTSSCACACIRQLQQAMRDHVEELRELDHRRGGRSADADVDGAARGPGRGSELLRRHRGVLPVDHRPRHRGADGHQDPPHDRPGGHRRRRRDHAVELPAPDQPRQDRARAGRGQHLGAQARTRHPVERRGARRADPRAHRHPRGRRQHRHVQRPRRRCAAVEGPARGHGVVHRVDEHRSRRDGRRRGHPEEGVPRTRRQVGVPGARRRGSRRRVLDVGVHGVDARRPGLRDHHPAGGAARPLRRGRRGGGGHDGGAQAGRPDRRGHHLRAGDLGAPARPHPGLPGLGDRRGRPVRLRRRTSRRPRHRASSSSRRSSPASTTTPRWRARRSSARC